MRCVPTLIVLSARELSRLVAMHKNTNLNRDTIDDASIPSEQRESEEMRSLVVPAVRPTEPVARPESSVSLWNWPTSGELRSGDKAVDTSDAAETARLTEPAADSLVEAEQPVLHDTLPSPPPSTDYGE